MRLLSTIKNWIVGALLAAFAVIALIQTNKADRYVRQKEKLEREKRWLEINAEAEDVRSRPTPADKHDILGRM